MMFFLHIKCTVDFNMHFKDHSNRKTASTRIVAKAIGAKNMSKDTAEVANDKPVPSRREGALRHQGRQKARKAAKAEEFEETQP